MRMILALSGFVLPTLFSETATYGQTAEQIWEAQSLLVRVDRNPGPIDGEWGRRTEAALISFLADKDISFDGKLSENELKLLRSEPVGPKWASRPHRANGRRIKHRTMPNGLVLFPDYDELPHYINPPPNDLTLGYYYAKWLRQRDLRGKYEVVPTGDAKPFKSDLRQSAFLDAQLRYSSMLSYLYYEDGQIVFDGLAPASRFSNFELSADTEFRSQSVGKSLMSYVVGHAVCEGYIESIDAPLSDWPLISDTLYAKRTLAEVLDMRARDQHIVTEVDGFVKTGRWFNRHTIATHVATELGGTKPNRRAIWNYNGLAANIAMNYAIFKVGEDWQALLDRVFLHHVGIANRFFFHQQVGYAKDSEGPGWASAYANRYDYLRIAVAIYNDWHSDTCIGQYLRDIYNNRKSMNHRFDSPHRMPDVAQSYGGQFWFDFKGMRNRPLFGMNGNNGQNVLIDMESGRIVVVNAAHTNFDWRTLVYTAIKTGKLPK